MTPEAIIDQALVAMDEEIHQLTVRIHHLQILRNLRAQAKVAIQDNLPQAHDLARAIAYLLENPITETQCLQQSGHS